MNVYNDIAKDMTESREKYIADACDVCREKHAKDWDWWRSFGEIIMCFCKCHGWGVKL